MVVTVHDGTPANSLAVRDELVRQTPVRLAELQDNLTIPARSHITSMVVTQDAEPRIVGKDQLRAVVVAVGAGIVGTAFLIAVIDGHLVRRRLARAQNASEMEGASAEETSAEAAADSPPSKLANGAAPELTAASADDVPEAWPLWDSPHSEPATDSNLREAADRAAKSRNGELRYLPTPDSLGSDSDDASQADTLAELASGQIRKYRRQ
jgi:hypothetical protein